MMKWKKRNKQKRIVTPMQMTQTLQAIGEEYSRRQAILCYLAIGILAVVMGLMFQLRPVYIGAVVIVYLLFVPRIMYDWKKQSYEKKRFLDVNAYMSQMTTSFGNTRNIQKSLQETVDTFPSGRMHDSLWKALEHMTNAQEDFRKTQREALEILEKEYGCEKLRNIHNFLLKAEERGGECIQEIRILENVRIAWENAALAYHKKLHSTRLFLTLEYALLLAVMIYILLSMPEDLTIIDMGMVQVANALQLVGFMLVFVHLDKRLNISLLRDARVMDQEAADRNFAYIQSFDGRKERIKNLPIIIIAAAVLTLLVVVRKTLFITGFSIVLFLLVWNMHHLIRWLTYQNLKSEIRKEFPKWLADIMLLIQNTSIEVAIFESVEAAPPVLVGELKRIRAILQESPRNADAYMSFFADFHIPDIEPVMRKLYSLSQGTGAELLTDSDKQTNYQKVMDVMIENNMKLLTQSENDKMKMRGDMSAVYQFLPLLPAALGMIVYGIALIILIGTNVMTLI